MSDLQETDSEESSDLRSVVEAAYDSAVEGAGGGESGSNEASSINESSVSGAPAEEEENPIPIPHGWASDKAELWQQMPYNARQYVYGRWVESDRFVNKRAQELANRAKEYEALERVIKPQIDELTLDGTSVDQIVGQALALRQLIKRDKNAAAAFFLDQLGLEPSQLMQHPQQPQVDPQILELRRELEGFKQAQIRQQQMQEAQLIEVTRAECNQIALERDEAGRPKYPLAPHLESAMAEVVPLIRREPEFRDAPTRTIFNEAYNRAALFNPQTRDIHLQHIRNSQLASQRERVDRVKTAAVSVNGSPTGVGKTPLRRYSTTREAAEAAYDELME
jgi:hypothetical protein